ncbi:unnamed protein product [Amoebophrya sp. A25]|nr:unnamed protein product [Amoebophrya sp. A25]|eukprot:GSA25T00004055001.1
MISTTGGAGRWTSRSCGSFQRRNGTLSTIGGIALMFSTCLTTTVAAVELFQEMKTDGGCTSAIASTSTTSSSSRSAKISYSNQAQASPMQQHEYSNPMSSCSRSSPRTPVLSNIYCKAETEQVNGRILLKAQPALDGARGAASCNFRALRGASSYPGCTPMVRCCYTGTPLGSTGSSWMQSVLNLVTCGVFARKCDSPWRQDGIQGQQQGTHAQQVGHHDRLTHDFLVYRNREQKPLEGDSRLKALVYRDLEQVRHDGNASPTPSTASTSCCSTPSTLQRGQWLPGPPAKPFEFEMSPKPFEMLSTRGLLSSHVDREANASGRRGPSEDEQQPLLQIPRKADEHAPGQQSPLEVPSSIVLHQQCRVSQSQTTNDAAVEVNTRQHMDRKHVDVEQQAPQQELLSPISKKVDESKKDELEIVQKDHMIYEPRSRTCSDASSDFDFFLQPYDAEVEK